MSTIQKVAKNVGWIICGNIIQFGIGIFTVACLVRYLGKEGFGVYSFILTYLGFFGILVDFGLSQILVREIARDSIKADKLLGNGVAIRSTLSFLAIFLSIITINFLGHPLSIKSLVYVYSLSFILSFGDIYRLIFQINLKMKYAILIDIFNSLTKLSIFLFLIMRKANLIWFLAGAIVTIIPGLFMTVLLSQKFIRPKFELDFEIWKKLFKEAWPIVLTGTFIMIYNRVDQMMLFYIKGAQAVGRYAAMVKISELFNVLPSAFMASVAPVLFGYFTTSVENLEKTYELCFKYMAVLVMPLVVLIFILAEPIVRIIYGPQLVDSSIVLKILIWLEIFMFLGAVHVNTLISVGLQKLDFLFTSATAAVNILLNIYLIPRYGIIGAAIAALASYNVGVLISCTLKATRKYGTALVRSTLKPVLAAGIMGGFTCLAFSFRINIIANIIISAIIYLGLIVLIGGLDNKDFEYFGKIIINRDGDK